MRPDPIPRIGNVICLVGGLMAAYCGPLFAAGQKSAGPPATIKGAAGAGAPRGAGGVAPAVPTAVVPITPPPADKKSAALDMQDATVDEKTGISTGKLFTYTEGETRVTGAQARYNKRTRELDAEGDLVLDDPKHHVTGLKSHVDRRKQVAIITGSVVIVLKPKTTAAPAPSSESSAATERAQGVVIHCDRVEDYYKRDYIVLTGHLVFEQKILKSDGKSVDRTLTAEHAEYDGKKEQMLLHSPVEGHDSEGQEMRFEKDATVGTREGDETLTSEGKVNLKFNLDDANSDDSSDSPPAQKTGSPPAAK